jgi:hypothetical protein
LPTGRLHYAAVSQAVRRLEDRQGRDRELQRAWSAAVQLLNVDSAEKALFAWNEAA